jgi:hypothetical protein
MARRTRSSVIICFMVNNDKQSLNECKINITMGAELVMRDEAGDV